MQSATLLRTICSSHPVLQKITDEAVEEFNVFRNHMAVLRQKEVPPSISYVLQSLVDSTEVLAGTFPNLSMVASLILLCPLGTPSVERSFSAMNRILTRLRQRMVVDNMEACMLVTMEGPAKLTDEEARDVVHKWHRQKNERRIRIPMS